jgi:hypothetical protein
MMIPGRLLHRVAAHICCATTLERVVEPAIADLQKEYASADRASRRAWVLVAGYFAVLKVIGVCALSVSGTTHDERRALSRTLAWSVGWISGVCALLMLPPLLNFDLTPYDWYAALTLVPQAVPLAIPIGIAFGMACGLSARPTMNLAKAMVIGAVAASALSFGVLAFALPAANQAFREITIRELSAQGYDLASSGLEKGPNEMTLTELRREEASFVAAGQTRLPRKYGFAFHLRFALAAATLALVSILLAAPITHRGVRLLIAFGACFGYWALLHAGEALAVPRTALPPAAAAWMPNVVFIAFALVVASSRSSRLRGSLSHAQ